MSHRWFYIKGGIINDETIGPITQRELIDLARTGKIKRDGLVLSPTHTKNQWFELCHIPKLLEIWVEGKGDRDEKKRKDDEERRRLKEERRQQQAVEKQKRLEAQKTRQEVLALESQQRAKEKAQRQAERNQQQAAERSQNQSERAKNDAERAQQQSLVDAELQQQQMEERTKEEFHRQQQSALEVERLVMGKAASERRSSELAAISNCTNYALLEKLVTEVTNILTSGECIECIAVQKKPVNVKPDAVVATSRRLIFFRPRLLGRFDFSDFLWRDLQNAHLVQGFLGSTFSARHVGGAVLTLDYLPKSDAQHLYRIAQEREEAAIEERRHRAMEERRAGAGGANIQVNTSPAGPAAPQPQTSGGDDVVQRLATLKTMLDQDLISLEEFETKKAEIIASV